MKEKIIVAMSGGVDSSVTAHMMKEEGYEVIGVTLDLFEGNEEMLKEAESVAKHIGVQWVRADYRQEFKEEIMSYFISTYRKGKTPNPCSYCNKYGKFSYMFRAMKEYGASQITTGHYARVVQNENKYFIAKGTDPKKDQSYYLTLLASFEIANLRFPLGEMTKVEIRKIAAEIGLPVAEKKDSQDVCFLMGEDYRDYLKRKIKPNQRKAGNFMLNDKILQKHEGIEFYTIGQRKGLGIGHHVPLYVSSIDSISGDVILTEDKNIGHKGVKLHKCQFGTNKHMGRATTKLRYRMQEIDCSFEILPDNKAILLLDKIQPAIAPGQIATLYDGDVIIGGGFIESVF